MYLTTMKAPPGRMPSCSRTIIIQLEDHKLVRSGLADSTSPRPLSTCSAYQINCRLGLLYFLNWTKTQQIIKIKAGRQNLEAIHKIKSSGAILEPKKEIYLIICFSIRAALSYFLITFLTSSSWENSWPTRTQISLGKNGRQQCHILTH